MAPFHPLAAVPNWIEALPMACFVAWFAYVGGCVGSFVHVLYHRLPRGEDFVYRGSACPQCGHAIRWRHNLPLIGWLVLRGRCYDCGAPIPARYWWFEVAFAAAFGGVGAVLWRAYT